MVRSLSLIPCLTIVLICSPAEAANIALCESDGTFNGYLLSQHTPDFENGINLINPDLSAMQGVPERYWKCADTDTPADGILDAVIEMTLVEKALVDAPTPAQLRFQASQDELSNSPLCNARLTEIEARIDALDLTQGTRVISDKVKAALKQLSRCIVALREVKD